MYIHFKERSYNKILFSHPNNGPQHWNLADMVYNEFSSTNNSVHLLFFLGHKWWKKSLLGMEDKKQDQKEEEKKGLELFDLNSNIYKWIFLTVYWVFQGEK